MSPSIDSHPKGSCWLRSFVVLTVLFTLVLTACSVDRATPTPTPTPRPEWQGDESAEALLGYLEGWPDSRKLFLDDDTLVWFMPNRRETAAEWASAALVYHLPSMSSITIDYDGNVGTCGFGWSPGKKYKSEDGGDRLESLIANEDEMQRIRDRIEEIQGGLAPQRSKDDCIITVVTDEVTPPDQTLEDLVKVHLKASGELNLQSPILLKLQLENTRSQPVKLWVDSCVFDFVVVDEEGTEVWNWRRWDVCLTYARELLLETGKAEDCPNEPWVNPIGQGAPSCVWFEWDKTDVDGNHVPSGTYYAYGVFRGSVDGTEVAGEVMSMPQRIVISF